MTGGHDMATWPDDVVIFYMLGVYLTIAVALYGTTFAIDRLVVTPWLRRRRARRTP